MQKISLVDSHCHLNLLDLAKQDGDLTKLIESARQNGVEFILSAGVTLEETPAIFKLTETYENVFCSVGVHPSEEDCKEATVDELVKVAQHKKVIAIGETGLDYYWQGDREKQKKQFRIHIQAAKQVKKPLILHARDCFDDLFQIIHEEKAETIGGVFHCFTGDIETAKKALDLGFYISISGIVTFKKATQVQEVAKNIPLNRLLLETDAPYLAPEPFRGKSNEPAFLKYTAEYVAKLRNISLQELAKQTTENFFKLFQSLTYPA